MLSSIGKVPDKGDGGKPGPDDGSIVHGACIDGKRHGHAEDDDGEDDPDDADSVDDWAKLSKRVRRVLDDLASADEVDQDGNTVRGGQANGGNASEGVEGSRRAKVDAAENAIDDSGQDERPNRHVKFVVDTRPQLVSWDSTITGKGVGAAGSGSEGSDTGEHEDSEDEEEKTEAAGGRTSHDLEQSANGLRVGHSKKHLNIGEDKEDGHQVDDASDTGGSDREDDGLGDFTLGVLDLLAHGSDHAVASKNVGTYPR